MDVSGAARRQAIGQAGQERAVATVYALVADKE
jgi:hypothetical protein